MSTNLHDRFEAVHDDFLKFERVENKLHNRPDLCAFLLLDKLCPHDGRDIVSAAEHDEIYLDVDTEKFAEVVSDVDILTLTRCGVMFDSETDSLSMFV